MKRSLWQDLENATHMGCDGLFSGLGINDTTVRVVLWLQLDRKTSQTRCLHEGLVFQVALLKLCADKNKPVMTSLNHH